MKCLYSYVIDDDSCLRITFNSSFSDDVKIMRYARRKVNCSYFRVMKAQRPYTVYKLVLVSLDSNDPKLYKLVKVGVID